MADFITIANKELTASGGNTLVTFDLRFFDDLIGGSKINGAVIDLVYDYTAVSDSLATSPTFSVGLGTTAIWSNVIANLKTDTNGTANGKIALTADFNATNPITSDINGKILTVTLLVTGNVTAFDVALQSTANGGVNSITTADSVSHALDGGVLIPTIDLTGSPTGSPAAGEIFADFQTVTSAPTLAGSTYVASMVFGANDSVDLFDSNSDGIPDRYLNHDTDGSEGETGTITIANDGTVTIDPDPVGGPSETARLAMSANGKIVGMYLPNNDNNAVLTLAISDTTRTVDEDLHNSGRRIAFNGSVNNTNIASGTVTTTEQANLTATTITDFNGYNLLVSLSQTSFDSNANKLSVAVSTGSGVFAVDSTETANKGKITYFANATYHGDTGVAVTAASGSGVLIGQVDGTQNGKNGQPLKITLNSAATTDIVESLASHIAISVRDSSGALTQNWQAVDDQTVTATFTLGNGTISASDTRSIQFNSQLDSMGAAQQISGTTASGVTLELFDHGDGKPDVAEVIETWTNTSNQLESETGTYAITWAGANWTAKSLQTTTFVESTYDAANNRPTQFMEDGQTVDIVWAGAITNGVLGTASWTDSWTESIGGTVTTINLAVSLSFIDKDANNAFSLGDWINSTDVETINGTQRSSRNATFEVTEIAVTNGKATGATFRAVTSDFPEDILPGTATFDGTTLTAMNWPTGGDVTPPPANAAPVWNTFTLPGTPPSYTAGQTVDLTIPVLATDADEGDTITYSAVVGTQSGGTFTPVSGMPTITLTAGVSSLTGSVAIPSEAPAGDYVLRLYADDDTTDEASNPGTALDMPFTVTAAGGGVGGGDTVTGTLKYWGGATPAAISGVTLTLDDKNASTTNDATDITEASGFSFAGVASGSYTLTATSPSVTGAVTTQDALDALKLAAGIDPDGNADNNNYQLLAADVDGDRRVTSYDAFLIMQYALGSAQSPYTAPDWIFVEAGDVQTQTRKAIVEPVDSSVVPGDSGVQLVGILLGDVNGSWAAA